MAEQTLINDFGGEVFAPFSAALPYRESHERMDK